MTDWLTILPGDCREVLRTLPDESINCVVTSPPYWGLRDYGTAMWEGGREDCDHKGAPLASSSSSSSLAGYTSDDVKMRTFTVPFRDTCGKCGARRIDAQLGLEHSPDEYVANLVDVFREVRRVLRDDGTVWLNLGDSYSSGGRTTHVAPTLRSKGKDAASGKQEHLNGLAVRPASVAGLGAKQLVGIPWRVAFALQADGWYLRSDIIWAKPNPMPESVTDRPTKSHEYVFLLTKSARYYFDAEGVREPPQDERKQWKQPRYIGAKHGVPDGQRKDTGRVVEYPAGRNIRTVWTIATQPYPGAHFATFPEALVEPCIKAGCPVGGTVLDPFGGSGTTARVANRLSRRAVLIELNPDYIEQAEARNAQAPLGLGA